MSGLNAFIKIDYARYLTEGLRRGCNHSQLHHRVAPHQMRQDFEDSLVYQRYVGEAI